jgi:hypothetical protein
MTTTQTMNSVTLTFIIKHSTSTDLNLANPMQKQWRVIKQLKTTIST